MNSPRSGVTLYMILAILLGMVIIGTTFTLNILRKMSPPPFLLEQKADYQMESAFVLCLSRLDNREAPAGNEPLIRQEIAPGAWLTVTARPDGGDAWLMDAQVKAESWTRAISARAVRAASPQIGTASSTGTPSPDNVSTPASVAAPVAQQSEVGPGGRTPPPGHAWKVFFLPASDAEKSESPARTVP